MDTAAIRPSIGYVKRLQRQMADLEYDRTMLLDIEGLTVSDLAFKEAVDGFRLMNKPDVMEDLIFMHGLGSLYDYYLSYNTALTAPYHNHYHVSCMVANCFEAAIYEDLTDEETRRLLIAALFHDFDHTAGKYDDMVNIKIASISIGAMASAGLLNHTDAEAVRETILVTQYPFVHEPKTKLQRIIRDADLMQVYEESDKRLLKQYLGLKKELETKLQHELTIPEFVAGMEKFFKEEVVWHSAWGLRKSQEHSYEAHVARLLQLLEDKGGLS